MAFSSGAGTSARNYIVAGVLGHLLELAAPTLRTICQVAIRRLADYPWINGSTASKDKAAQLASPLKEPLTAPMSVRLSNNGCDSGREG